jgi:hypothetical protein
VRLVRELRPDWSLSLTCRLYGVPRSGVYRKTHSREESALREAIVCAAAEWPRYGSVRICRQLRRDGALFDGRPAGERRVRRVMRETGLRAKVHPRKIRTIDSAPRVCATPQPCSRLGHHAPRSGLGHRYHLRGSSGVLCVSRRDNGCFHSRRSRMGTVKAN